MNYPEAIDWLYATQGIGIKLGLANIERLLSTLGLPVYPSAPSIAPIIHVAGTNGKGSVCAMLDAICRAAGLRTGLFTSPHLITYRERIRLNGAMIPQAAVAEWLTRLRREVAHWEHPPTFFELTTALAFAWFREQGAQVIILETGLGGRLDSSNSLPSALTLLTPISLDHQQFLGESLTQIAAEKAGIIKPGIPVFSALQPEEAACVITQAASNAASPLHWVTTPFEGPVNLPGSHQRWNAALAAAAIRHLPAIGLRIGEDAITSGLSSVVWPGRFQRLDHAPRGHTIILDGAHNAAAAARLCQTWRETYGDKPASKPTILLGALSDKDIAAIIAEIAPLARRFFLAPVRNPRSATPAELACIIRQYSPSAPCSLFTSGEEALAAFIPESEDDRLLITGSLFLIGDLLAHLQHAERDPVSAQ